MRELLAEGYTADQICTAMQEVFQGFQPKFPGDHIQSFAYCAPRVREEKPAGIRKHAVSCIEPEESDDFRKAFDHVRELWLKINGREPNPIEYEELAKIGRRCDHVARCIPHPDWLAAGGAGWVAAAIVDAVKAGSEFLAVRRVEVIVDRWREDGPPWQEEAEADWQELPAASDAARKQRKAELVTTPVETASGPMPAHQVWERALSELALQMTKPTFDTWLKNTWVVACEDNTLIVGLRAAYAKDWIENRLLRVIGRTLVAVVGRQLAVEFVVASPRGPGGQASERPALNGGSPSGSASGPEGEPCGPEGGGMAEA